MAGAGSLNLVREELEATIGSAEGVLEQFIDDRESAAHLQECVDYLAQIQGTLKLIELSVGELLAQEMLNLADDISPGAGDECDSLLSALSSGFFVLRRYLEYLHHNPSEVPELLLPHINDVRCSHGLSRLPESYFYSVRLQAKPCDITVLELPPARRTELSAKLRQMYQFGLLALVKSNKSHPNATMMSRALWRLRQLYADQPCELLFASAAAALEGFADADLHIDLDRKRLLLQVDKQIRLQLNQTVEAFPEVLLKELLYLSVLADSDGPYNSEIKQRFNLPPLPFNDVSLREERLVLCGPGNEVFKSVSAALHEELRSLKDQLDMVERRVEDLDYSILQDIVTRLPKTLAMVGLHSASKSLQAHQHVVRHWQHGEAIDLLDIEKLAESVLYVESMVAALERNEPKAEVAADVGHESEAMASNQLTEAHIVIIGESQSGLALVKRSITAYTESDWDPLHLQNIAQVMASIRGGLVFVQQERAAKIFSACETFIDRKAAVDAAVMSSEELESFADALTAMEFYLQSLENNEENKDVLELAEFSIRQLAA